MAYNRKIKSYTIRRGVLSLIGILFTGAFLLGGYFLYGNAAAEKAVDAFSGKNNTISGNTVIVARAKLSMRQGELFDASKAELVEIPAELAPAGAITDLSKLGKVRLKRELAEKEFLNSLDFIAEDLLFEEGDRLIEHNFAEGAVPASVTEGSAIDIKLFVKGEEDRVVVSQAVVVSRNASLLSFYMNEQEQEFIKEAAAEGLLFAAQYIDASQAASNVTYVPLYDKRKLRE